jgi:hypothetical protein
VQDGRLVIKQVVEVRHGTPLFLAWPTQHRGEALTWLLNRLEDASWREGLLA